MGIFDGIKEVLDNLCGINGTVWVKRQNDSLETIESCNGQAKEDKKTHTCALCVALNHTVFRNDNKPDYCHINCKCKNEEYRLTDITEDFPTEKITNYLFVDKEKHKMMRAMGYRKEDAEFIHELLSRTIRTEFMKGNYKLGLLNRNGQHFEIKFNLNGARDHTGEIFGCHIGCVAWPYGKIKVATPLIQDKKLA